MLHLSANEGPSAPPGNAAFSPPGVNYERGAAPRPAEAAPLAEASPSVSPAAPESPAPTPRAHSLMLDALLVIVVGLLAIVAGIVALHRHNRQEIITQVARDFTQFKTEFQDYLGKTASPSDHPAADTETPRNPPFRSAIEWSAPTPAGGSYRWEPIQPSAADPSIRPALRARITAFAPNQILTLSVADLTEIDRQIDDGNLETGAFRTGFAGWPELTIRARP